MNGTIGHYSLLRHLGSGGSSSVYLVERSVGAVVQRSALKMLAPHAAGASFVKRFEREQRILAALDHANITRMLDAGLTENGQPYLVMEYVDGMHLDVYCDARKLTIPERLELFLHVCDAVGYAHSHLVVHLDLKPSNILVGTDGVVKLLDFGTSRLLQPQGQLTSTVLLTPAYASPEQLRNEPVTTASDVYALGAILFELLAGRRARNPFSMAMIIDQAKRETEPERLPRAVTGEAAADRGVSESRLREWLSGDLATIVAKCLSPRPRDRYASVDALATDIGRYRSGRTILARRQTVLYWAGKFIRRNRAVVAVAGLVFLMLLGSVGYAGWRQRAAIRDGVRAERMQRFMYALFKHAKSSSNGRPAMRVNEFLMMGERMLPAYIDDRADLRKAQLSLGDSLLHNSDYGDALQVFSEVRKTAQADGDINAETESSAQSGDIAFRQGRLDEGKLLTARALQLAHSPTVTPIARVMAERVYAMSHEVYDHPAEENMQILHEAIDEAKSTHLPSREMAELLFDMGYVLRSRNRLDEAKAFFRQTEQIDQQDPTGGCTMAEPEGELGHIELWQGKFADSLVDNERAYETALHCFGEDSREALSHQRYVAQDLIALGRAPEALQRMERAIAVERRLDQGAGGPYLALALYVLANAEDATGHPEKAEEFAKEEMEMTKGKLDPGSRGFGSIYLIYASALAHEHHDRESLIYAGKACKVMTPVAANATYQDKVRSSQACQLVADLEERLGVKGGASGPSGAAKKSTP